MAEDLPRPEAPSEPPAKSSTKLLVADGAVQRPFMRGIMIHALLGKGLSFEDAYRVALAEGYRMLEAQMQTRAQPGMISAISLFDAVREDVYNDNCCHFNARGETMFAEFLAARVGDWLAEQSKVRP